MTRISRRLLLKSMSAGAAVIALPFLRTMRAHADTPARPKRMGPPVMLCRGGSGIVRTQYRPGASDKKMDLIPSKALNKPPA